MNLGADEPKALLSKSLSLIEKTCNSIAQLDRSRFPTDSTEDGRVLLIAALEELGSPGNIAPMDPAVLYNRLLSLQELREIIERSSTDRISWPLVSYCDHIWNRLFGDHPPKLFYSLTPEHNYSILRFSKRLAATIRDLLPQAKVDSLIQTRDCYCLQLASSEDDNLPQYANIGHEFGHAIFDHHRHHIAPLLQPTIAPILSDIRSRLESSEPAQALRRFRRVIAAISKTAEELFCDVVGAMLMGPAFFLSLFELSWGQTKNAWTFALSPDNQLVRAYPSFPFRLFCIRQFAKVDGFCKEAKERFPIKVTAEAVRALADCLTTVPVDDRSDMVRVRPANDDDAVAITKVLTDTLGNLKTALRQFVLDAEDLVKKWCDGDTPLANSWEVGALLERLAHDILPNITPDSTLLGKRAAFAAILNASALFRMQILTGTDSNELQKLPARQELSRRTGLVERLTAKAFEVTFIQQEYQNQRKP